MNHLEGDIQTVVLLDSSSGDPPDLPDSPQPQGGLDIYNRRRMFKRNWMTEKAEKEPLQKISVLMISFPLAFFVVGLGLAALVLAAEIMVRGWNKTRSTQ